MNSLERLIHRTPYWVRAWAMGCVVVLALLAFLGAILGLIILMAVGHWFIAVLILFLGIGGMTGGVMYDCFF